MNGGWFSAELVVETNRLPKNISKLKECQKRILGVEVNSSFVSINVKGAMSAGEHAL